MTTLFDNETDPAADYFELFWRKFPRDRFQKTRKSGKSKAREIWKRDKLDARFDHVMAVLDEDIADIKKGVYAFCVNSENRMHKYKGIIPWLNQRVWDRDLIPKPAPPPKPLKPVAGPVMDEKPVTKEFLAELRKKYLGGPKPPTADVVDTDGVVVRRTEANVE